MTPMASPRSLSLVSWTADDLQQRMDELLDVYASAMGYHRTIMEWRRGFIASHTQRVGFRAVATLSNNRLVGFSYGYLGRPGQWWHDQVRAALSVAAYAQWLSDCFEIVELHVHPEVQGAGVGQRQLAAILRGVQAHTVVLSTPEQPAAAPLSPAWRLYRRCGFVDVIRRLRFPGDERPFAVLGRTLPPT
ncbi:MAG: GNAT family N-acetyltransferase [Mycobacteriales bacterium]